MATLDAKYRDILPDMVKDLPFGPLSEDESASITSVLVKNVRKSKKTKIGKNGLYLGEEASISRWWLNRDPPTSPCDSAEAREDAIRLAVLEQRARETQMQIILALEVLALESPSKAPSAGGNPIGRITQGNEGSQVKKKKAKKPQDLITLLDLLVDRLTIWQSMSVDEDKTSKEGKNPCSQNSSNPAVRTSSGDHLQQFCVDIVLPL